jgi:hypothetical protein
MPNSSRNWLFVWFGLALSFGATLYCLLALGMVASLSGAPNYSLERARFNGNFWGSGLIISALTTGVFLWLLLRKKPRELGSETADRHDAGRG